MKNIKAMVPLSVKREIKHIIKYICRKEYRNFWTESKERRQYKTSFGEKNPDKVFYVIRRDSHEGFGSVLKNVIGELEYAKRKKYIPVIDYLNYYDHLIQTEENKGKENAWEYYFRQVSDFSLDEVYKSKNVIMSNSLDSKHWIYRDRGLRVYSDANFRSKLHKVLEEYCVLSDDVKINYDREYERIKSIVGGEKILAVSAMLREADIYASGNLESNYVGRGIQPRFSELVCDIHQCMKQFDCKYVFMSADSDKYYAELRSEFRDKIIFSDRRQVSNKADIHSRFDNEIRTNPRTYTIGYITDMYLLASCNSLLASESSTSQIACIINGNQYENIKIYHLGVQK